MSVTKSEREATNYLHQTTIPGEKTSLPVNALRVRQVVGSPSKATQLWQPHRRTTQYTMSSSNWKGNGINIRHLGRVRSRVTKVSKLSALNLNRFL